MAPPIAHVRLDPESGWIEHALDEHLRTVGSLADEFAHAFGSGEWARIAGLWHDLGKYSAEFQAYIKRASGYEPEAHIEGGAGRVDHSTAGAIFAVQQFPHVGRIVAYLIAGHHAGLPDWHSNATGAASLSARLTQTHLLERTLVNPIAGEVLEQSVPRQPIPGGGRGFAIWVRMLFSCLVDADFLDTERFMDPRRSQDRAAYEPLKGLKRRFDAHMTEMLNRAADTPVNRTRREVLGHCRGAARSAPGAFSLTVPTGGGKTLSGMAFALEHALRYGKQRIVYVIPYTSIIEQTANIFRQVFGNQVVEHHSNLDPDQETAQSRLATENWDAPIVVTTNVQFFESLFAAKPSRCRKLHNIVNSIVVLDEAQLLPPEFLQPILNVLRILTEHYGVTLLLSTATQPALDSRQGFERNFRDLDGVREIIPEPDALYSDLERVQVHVPDELQRPQAWEAVAAELAQYESVLCVVNRREDCRALWRLMPPGTIHLSALMCGEHRSRVITAIKAKLSAGEPMRVVSTQLVEAGVDLDFPVVYRAMAGLDSIAQAAGRCNREGRLQRGKVVVFVPPSRAPPGLLRIAEQVSTSLLSGYTGNPLARPLFKTYFERLYWSAPSLDNHGIEELLTRDARDLNAQFRTASERFRLIDESGYQPVFVIFGDGPGLVGVLEREGPQRWLTRNLHRYTVNLPKHQFEALLAAGDVHEVQPGMYAQVSPTLYDERQGLLVEGTSSIDPQYLVVA